MSNLEEGDIVLCTVERIEGTVVHVKIEGNGEGSIITSEIAPGRIRNLRDYVVPNKKIVCKILRLSPSGHVDLSLRRVTTKEKKEVLEEYNKGQTVKTIIKSIVKDHAPQVIEQVEKKGKISEFLGKFRDNPESYKSMFQKEDFEKIMQIASKQKIKKIIMQKEISFSTDLADGLNKIKKILEIKTPKTEMKYLAAGKYLLRVETENVKEASKFIQESIEIIENKAKQEKIQLIIKDKK